MINLSTRSRTPLHPSIRYRSFTLWRQSVVERGTLPVIGVTGSRGKTTVVRLLDAILTQAGLTTATRTNVSVEIRGDRQRGEIAPWSRALAELAQGTLDIAIEEFDWLTIHTMGLERETFPAFAITNVCANRDACLIQGDARRAMACLPIVFEAVHSDGMLVINGDDFDVSREELEHNRASLFVGLNQESPGLRDHLARGGTAAWTKDGRLFVSGDAAPLDLGPVTDLHFALYGRAGFQLHNALIAGAIAASIGVEAHDIRGALQRFHAAGALMPDSFQMIDLDGVSAVIDRPNPSWFLRPVLRSLRDFSPNRIISIVGRLAGVPASDLPEVGRLIGRNSALVVSHSEHDEPARAAAIKQGAAQNEVPAVIVHTKSEGRALSRALSMARRGDVVLVLADRPELLARTLLRAARTPGKPAMGAP